MKNLSLFSSIFSKSNMATKNNDNSKEFDSFEEIVKQAKNKNKKELSIKEPSLVESKKLPATKEDQEIFLKEFSGTMLMKDSDVPFMERYFPVNTNIILISNFFWIGQIEAWLPNGGVVLKNGIWVGICDNWSETMKNGEIQLAESCGDALLFFKSLDNIVVLQWNHSIPFRD